MKYPAYQCFTVKSTGQTYCSPTPVQNHHKGNQWIKGQLAELGIPAKHIRVFLRHHAMQQEFESEGEYEGEFEYEYEGELEAGHDRESECEFSHEYESEQFLPLLAPLLGVAARAAVQGLGRLAVRGIAKQVSKQAVRQATNGDRNNRQREFEAEFEAEGAPRIDPYIAKLISRLGKGELQSESESEAEYEFISAPMSESEVMMENLAYRAAESESEAEAEAFLGALVPVSARLFPKSSLQVISSVSPSLIQGVATIAAVLHKSPKKRPLLRTVPYILQETLKTLAGQAQAGKLPSETTAIRVLAGNTAKVLANPQHVAKVMKKSHRAQHHHQTTQSGW